MTYRLSRCARRSRCSFPAARMAVDWQKLACAIAARNRFAVITGGPGTGKTTTVVRLLGLLQAQALTGRASPVIRLAAPTGKAAARLGESIAGAVKDLGPTHCRAHSRCARRSPLRSAARSTGCSAAGRLSPLSAPRRNPLSVDVLVIDEASRTSR